MHVISHILLGFAAFVVGGFQDLSGSSPEQPGLTPGLPLLGGGWTGTASGHLKSKLLCDAMNSRKHAAGTRFKILC